MIILIYLILLFKSFFSSTIYHYQNTEEIQLDSLHINKSLDLFCKTYNNDFWGERKRTGLESQKQKALLEEIHTIFKESGLIRLKKILKSAFICSIEKEEVVKQSIFLRVPVYYGAIQTALFNNDYFLQLRKHLNEKWYDYDDEIKIFDKTHIVFPALITPYYKWTKENTLMYAGEMGVVVSNGVNFESQTSSDYKKFMPEIRQGNKTNLIKFIDDISQCLVYAAYKLAINQEVKVINLNIPSFGVSSFGTCYPDKEELASFYFNAIYTALEGYKDVMWYVNFHNYNQKEHYEKAFMSFRAEIEQNRKCSNIVLDYHDKSNLYNEDLMPKNIRDMPKKRYLIVWTHAGDAHSFIGNGGSSDSSLESKFIGIGNRHYLHVTPILNLFLHDIAFARSSLRPYPYREVLSEARMGKPSVSDSLLIPEEGFDKKKSNKNYIWWISGIGISALLFIFIYKKINPVRFIQ